MINSSLTPQIDDIWGGSIALAFLVLFFRGVRW